MRSIHRRAQSAVLFTGGHTEVISRTIGGPRLPPPADFCAERGIVSDIELVGIQQVFY